MFTATQIILVILWFTFYNVLTTLTGIGLVAGGVVADGLVTGLIMNLYIKIFMQIHQKSV